MVKKSELHYYPDGDIVIFADDTTFCVHQLILKMASSTLLSKQEQKQENDLPLINLPNVSASIVDIALSIIYPRYFIMPTWKNVDALLQLASDYKINKIYVAGVTFLDQNFKQNPMYTFYLADKYQFSFLFEETSKLVLDNFLEYKDETAFKRLPPEIQSELERRSLNYTHSFAKISIKYFLSTYQHTCGNAVFHNKELKQEIESRVLTILDQPFKSPSAIWNIMHAHIDVTDGIDCNNYFMTKHLPRKFQAIFGNFKCLDADKNDKNPNQYIYIQNKRK